MVCGKRTVCYPLCKRCKNEYFDIEKTLLRPRCSICGKILISTQNKCPDCKEKPVLVHTDMVIPLFSYRLWNKELMFLWKQKEIRSLSFLFADFIAQTLKKYDMKIVVPVPPRPGKITEKGWDQIQEICTVLKYKYDVQVLAVLQRNSEKQQKKLNRVSRLETIGNAYSLCNMKKLKKELLKYNQIFPEKVCVIDDVSTTGATIECCSEILKKAGVKQVNVITLFTVD